MTVMATARTSVPKGSPTRCAITSAWWTAAITAAISPIPHSTARTFPTPANAASTRRPNDRAGTSQVQAAIVKLPG